MTKEEILQYIKNELDNNENAEIYLDVDDYKIIIEALEQQPCEDCISREEIISKISEYADGFENGGYFSGDSVEDAIMACVGMADELPSVTPTHKKGKWIKEYDNSALDGLYHCSICGRKLWIPKEQSFSDYPFCHCGADMRGEKDA